MWDIFLQTLPFFMLIALGYGSGRTGFFSPEATAYLTKFVFYFALSAMLFRFSANLSLAEIFDWQFVWAYLGASAVIYVFATFVALRRRVPVTEAAVEAQCAVIGKPEMEVGEAPVAFVQLMPDANVDDTNLMEFINNQVAAYKKIREVRLLDAIPVSAAGKVLKRELRDML